MNATIKHPAALKPQVIIHMNGRGHDLTEKYAANPAIDVVPGDVIRWGRDCRAEVIDAHPHEIHRKRIWHMTLRVTDKYGRTYTERAIKLSGQVEFI